jgi:hypothetical protein
MENTELIDADFALIEARNWIGVCLQVMGLCWGMLREARKKRIWLTDSNGETKAEKYPRGKSPWSSKSLMMILTLRLVTKEEEQ